MHLAASTSENQLAAEEEEDATTPTATTTPKSKSKKPSKKSGPKTDQPSLLPWKDRSFNRKLTVEARKKIANLPDVQKQLLASHMPFIGEYICMNRTFLVYLGLVAARLHEAVTANAIASRLTIRVELEINPSIVYQAYSPFFKRNMCANEVQSIQACG